MSQRFTDYHEAYNAAVDEARACNLDVAIRAVKEYGKRLSHIFCSYFSESFRTLFVEFKEYLRLVSKTTSCLREFK